LTSLTAIRQKTRETSDNNWTRSIIGQCVLTIARRVSYRSSYDYYSIILEIRSDDSDENG